MFSVGSGYLMKADVKTMPNSMCCNQVNVTHVMFISL